MNFIGITGRLGKDPEIKYLDSGKIVCKFSLGVRRPFTSDKTDWFNIEIWGKQAELAAQHLKKGSQAGFTGYHMNDRYEDKDGNKRDFWKLSVNTMDFLGSKSEASGEAATSDESIPF